MVKRFGDFAFDAERRSLKVNGQQVVLKGQALDLLVLLLEQPGKLVTREAIERRLWPDRTVDFSHSLDVIVSRLRAVLGDKGPSPRYIETVPRRGYRFIERVTATPQALHVELPRPRRHRLVTYALVAVVAALLALLFVRTRYDKFVPSSRTQASPTIPAH